MRVSRTSIGMLLGILTLMAWGPSALADDKPDALALLKLHPEFVTLTKVTNVIKGRSWLDITLCRHTTGDCERFNAAASRSDDLADYVYLFAVFKGKYAPSKPVTQKGRKWLGNGLLQDAQDKGYGQTLLDHYSSKTACGDQKDIPGCVLHSLFGSIKIQRFIVERGDAGEVGILTADEDGTGDPFLH